ncbi:MAG TPA: YfhO family protein [Candidatus Baltobacteraceae bacterium]|nr:YfhO family protein [Candidatus Baltobacteraceae bacterium]
MNRNAENTPRAAWWRRSSARDIFWFAALAGVLFVLLHESLFMGKGLVPADAVLNWPPWNQTTPPSNIVLADQYRTFLPTAEFVHQQASLPLWNPDLCCGVPNLGAIQGALLFPIRLLFSPLDPFSASGPSAFVKLLLAGWFTLLYLRLLGVSRPAAFLAGLVFSLSGFMIVWLGHPHVNSAMWLPLLLYFVEKSFRGGRGNAVAAPALRGWVGFAVAFAFMILGGHPPTAIHVTIVVVIYFLFRLRERRGDHPLQRAALLAGSIAAGLLLAAPQILPFLEYYSQSSSPQSSASLAQWSLHLTPASLIRFLVPNALGNPAKGFVDLPDLLGWREADQFRADNFNERTGYVGIVPLFLAACAIALRRCQFTKFFMALAIGSMLVIFGVPPFADLARVLPVLRYVNETRLLLIAGFSVAVLAGLGWDELSRTASQRPVLLVTVGFLAVAGLVLLCFGLVAGPKFHNLDPSHWAFLRRQFLILLGGIIVIVILAFWPGQRNGWIPVCVCLGWTAVDLLCFAIGYNPSISRDRYYPPTPAIELLQNDRSPFRIFGGGMVLAPNCAEVFGLSDARGCDYMTVRRYEELITGHAGDFFFYRNAKDFPGAFPLLNVKYILSATALPLNPALFELVYSREILIYRFKQCLDRALLVFDYQVEPDRSAIRARVSSGGFDPRQVLLLEDQPVPANKAVDVESVETNPRGSVRIISYQPDYVQVGASLPRPGYLLLLDTWFPGWSATVNGGPAPIYRADYNFRAVPLPAGKSTVAFSYRPASLRIGMYLCAAGVLVLCAAWFLPSKRNEAGDLIGVQES